MSEEKKISWEASAAQEPKQAAPRAEIEAAPAPAAGPAADGGSSGSGGDRQSRAKHQHVLPGILGKQLRTAYGELLNTPVPDSIKDVVKRLKEAETSQVTDAHEEEGSK